MMKETEIKAWRDIEKERLNDLHMTISKDLCRNTINVLTQVLKDD